VSTCVCVCVCVGVTQKQVEEGSLSVAIRGCVDGRNPLICCSVLQCVAVGCSELNCAAERFLVCHVSAVKYVCVCVCVRV